MQTIQAVRPDLVRLAFEEHTPRLLAILSAPLSEQLAFADSVSIGATKVRLAEPWFSGFDLFGKLPEVRAEQLRRAREDFFDPRVGTAARSGLSASWGSRWRDIHVQNGSVKRAAAAEILAAPTPADEAALRRRIANAVADASGARFREDVRSRKLAIAQGAGAVHGEAFVVEHWGIADFPAPL